MITLGMCTLWRLFMFAEQKLSPRVRAVSAIVLASLVLCDFIFNCTYFFITCEELDRRDFDVLDRIDALFQEVGF